MTPGTLVKVETAAYVSQDPRWVTVDEANMKMLTNDTVCIVLHGSIVPRDEDAGDHGYGKYRLTMVTNGTTIGWIRSDSLIDIGML